jgi:hypothetical protein
MRFVRFAMCPSTLLCSVCLSLVSSPLGREYFVQTTTAIVVFPRASFPVIKNNITRVLASAFEKTETANNLLTKYTGSHFPYWELQDSKDQIVLKTSRLVANVRSLTSVGTGAVLFSDNTGKPPLHEQPVNTLRLLQKPVSIMFYKSNGTFINRKPVPRRSK